MGNISIDFERCLKKFGQPTGGEPVSNRDLNHSAGRIPQTFLDFVSTYGFGKWRNGYFQLCSPSKYHSVVQKVFEGDADIKPERSHVVGFSAFGRLLVWNQDYGVTEIDLVYGRVLCDDLIEPDPDPDGDISLGVALANIDAGSFDLFDDEGHPLFGRVLKAYGELEFGQIYALKLHPALGGPVTIENFRPADALTALTIAAQAALFTLYDSTQPHVPAVRMIGSGGRQ